MGEPGSFPGREARSGTAAGRHLQYQNRKLSTLRKEAGQAQTQLVNKIKHILRRHNLQWELPTKTFPTARALAWLREISLPEIDRLEMNFLLPDLNQVQERLRGLEELIAERGRDNPNAQLLKTMPGIGTFTAISLASRIGDVKSFLSPIPEGSNIGVFDESGFVPLPASAGNFCSRLSIKRSGGTVQATRRLRLARIIHTPFLVVTGFSGGCREVFQGAGSPSPGFVLLCSP